MPSKSVLKDDSQNLEEVECHFGKLPSQKRKTSESSNGFKMTSDFGYSFLHPFHEIKENHSRDKTLSLFLSRSNASFIHLSIFLYSYGTLPCKTATSLETKLIMSYPHNNKTVMDEMATWSTLLSLSVGFCGRLWKKKMQQHNYGQNRHWKKE